MPHRAEPASIETLRSPLHAALLGFCALGLCAGQSKVWVADNGDGTYKNPILYADYSDPDAIRVGDDFYLVASSFNSAPGLPILHSKDLVNWTILGHALPEQPPLDVYSKPRHGAGVWAPAIRYHAGQFFIFYPDPDYGIYMIHARQIAGPWSAPLLIKAAKGWEDPCPLWDDDGRAYLVNAMAASRSGIKSVILISRMSPDGARLLDNGTLVYDGHAQDPTIEGPKLYKRNGWYYIFAPAGGVTGGWQVVLRSRRIYGPYERRVVLAQGKTPINGPHQGAWVETQTGQSWFLHFQDKGAYGRIVHLEPMHWVEDWPVVGDDGSPVLRHAKPNVGKTWPVQTPAESDDFRDSFGLQWQWAANPQPGWALPTRGLGFLRLIAVPFPEGFRNFWDVPNLLLQKFPGPKFTATASLTFTPHGPGEEAGLIVTGQDYAYIAVRKTADGVSVVQAVCKHADRGSSETQVIAAAPGTAPVYLRVDVAEGAVCRFRFSADGRTFTPLGEPFTALPGRWIGAKMGLFAIGGRPATEYGYADFHWFQVE